MVIQFGPPKAQVKVLEFVSAANCPSITFGAPGDHIGGKNTGEHGPLPVGFLVAGFEGELHMPKVPVGKSITVKAGTFPALTFC